MASVNVSTDDYQTDGCCPTVLPKQPVTLDGPGFRCSTRGEYTSPPAFPRRAIALETETSRSPCRLTHEGALMTRGDGDNNA